MIGNPKLILDNVQGAKLISALTLFTLFERNMFPMFKLHDISSTTNYILLTFHKAPKTESGRR